MITVRPSRIRPASRVPTPSDKTPVAQAKTYLPPIAGWVTNSPLAAPRANSAVVLENFWPTATGIEPRGGTLLRCTIAGAVGALFEYVAGSKFFAADTANVYEFTDSTPDATALVASFSGQTSSDYSTLEMQTDAGSFLTIVNGADHAQIYDGTSWQQVTDVSAPHAIAGVATNLLSHVWAYRNRTFFIESGTMNAWYLGINSVSGPATKLPLAGVFRKGGALMFGATWSSDSGAGMDDRCVFGTDKGEFAVYVGDPADQSWDLQGVYDIGDPLDKNAIIQVGGDLIIATKAGLIPISAATMQDEAVLELYAHSEPIDTVWKREVIFAGGLDGWQVAKWATRNMAVVTPPGTSGGQGYCWVVNLQTKAWAKFTGWVVDSMSVLGNALHYGDNAGNIFMCDTGGFDNGMPFECRACLGFDHLNAPGSYKTAHALRAIWKFQAPFIAKHSVASDYKPAFPTAPSARTAVAGGDSAWDISDWDVADWASDDDTYSVHQTSESVSAHGEVLAPQIQLTSAQNAKLDCELIAARLTYSTGTPQP